MRINGQKVEGLNEEIIPIPRGNGRDIFFIARAVPDLTPFLKVCPRPEPPLAQKRIDGVMQMIPNFQDKVFIKKINDWAEMRTAWMVVNSLLATPGFEWESVELDNPDTFQNYKKEFADAGFSDSEQESIIMGVAAANGLDQRRIEEAKKRFLAMTPEQQSQQNYRMAEQLDMQSGVHVNGSASNTQDSKASNAGTT